MPHQKQPLDMSPSCYSFYLTMDCTPIVEGFGTSKLMLSIGQGPFGLLADSGPLLLSKEQLPVLRTLLNQAKILTSSATWFLLCPTSGI